MHEAIIAEVNRSIDYDFVWEEQHPEWFAGIVLVMKENDKVRICIDFRDRMYHF